METTLCMDLGARVLVFKADRYMFSIVLSWSITLNLCGLCDPSCIIDFLIGGTVLMFGL